MLHVGIQSECMHHSDTPLCQATLAASACAGTTSALCWQADTTTARWTWGRATKYKYLVSLLKNYFSANFLLLLLTFPCNYLYFPFLTLKTALLLILFRFPSFKKHPNKSHHPTQKNITRKHSQQTSSNVKVFVAETQKNVTNRNQQGGWQQGRSANLLHLRLYLEELFKMLES